MCPFPGDLRLDQLLPGLSPAQRKDKVRALTDWIKSTPLAKRPLVKLSVKVLSDEGVKALQTMVAPVPAYPPAALEYENVPPLLMLLPYTPGADQVRREVIHRKQMRIMTRGWELEVEIQFHVHSKASQLCALFLCVTFRMYQATWILSQLKYGLCGMHLWFTMTSFILLAH